FFDAAADVMIDALELRWEEAVNISRRQDRLVHLSGLAGIMLFTGLCPGLQGLLRLLPFTNIGKKCNYGCGHAGVFAWPPEAHPGGGAVNE
ncbi:MAG: hypothetical protein AAF492_16470, partial [Verrucomicrobiota bacterium]